MRIWRAETLWLMLVAVLLVLAVWWFPGSASLKTDSYSVSYSGKKALYQSLRRLDTDVSRSAENLIPRPGYNDRLLVLGPARTPSSEEWDALYFEVLKGASLLYAAAARDPYAESDRFGARVVPMWEDESMDPADDEQTDDAGDESGESEADRRDSADGSGDDTTTSSASDDADDDDDDKAPTFFREEFVVKTNLVEGAVKWTTRARIELDDEEWDVLVSANSQPQVVRRQIGRGTIVMVATDDVFSNQALTDPRQALLAYRLIEAAPAPAAGRTWLDESLNRSGVPKVLGILFDPALRPMTLQLILLAVLFGWSGSRRFGPAEPPATPARRSIVEHAEAVGVLYYRAGAGAHAVRSQMEYLKQEMRRLYGRMFHADSAAALSQQAGLEEADVRQLLTQASVPPDGKLSNAAAGRLLRRLTDLSARVRSESGPGRRLER